LQNKHEIAKLKEKIFLKREELEAKRGPSLGNNRNKEEENEIQSSMIMMA